MNKMNMKILSMTYIIDFLTVPRLNTCSERPNFFVRPLSLLPSFVSYLWTVAAQCLAMYCTMV